MEIENPAVGSLSIFLVLLFQPHNPKTLCKLRRTWYKIAKIDRIKSAHLQPDRHFLASHVQHAPGTPITTYTSDSDADIPFPPDAAVLSFSRSGSGWLTMDASWPTFSSVDCWLIYEQRIWKLETRFDKCNFMGRKSVNSLIRWLHAQYINRYADAYWRKQIDSDGDRRCLFQIPDINIHLLINKSINLSIYQQK